MNTGQSEELRAGRDWWDGIPTTDTVVPIIDPTAMSREDLNKAVVHSLESIGLVVWRSPNMETSLRERMQRLMAKFFALPEAAKKATVNAAFQGGWTPEFTEKPVDISDFINSLAPDQRPFTPTFPKDPKERYMCGVGPRRSATRFPVLTPPTRILPGHEKWHSVMGKWGSNMMRDAEMILDAYAGHYGLDRHRVFRLKYGAHIVAPTSTNLLKYSPQTVVADTHADMGVLSGHEPSVAVLYRPKTAERKGWLVMKPCGGLIVWTRDGRRLRVAVPPGCRLFQAGFQFTHITDGRVLSGMHQVIVPPAAEELVKLAHEHEAGVQRISATIFIHLDADTRIVVPEVFRTPGKDYPKIWAGKTDMDVLDKIFAQ